MSHAIVAVVSFSLGVIAFAIFSYWKQTRQALMTRHFGDGDYQ